ncbi:MAG: hypothetical protein NVSMB31_15150 [Vulcanimicrobiaceae bacterium]
MKILAIVLTIVFVALGILAWTGSSTMMPALGLDGTHHTKHAIGYFVLAILCLVWMRMSGAPEVRR